MELSTGFLNSVERLANILFKKKYPWFVKFEIDQLNIRFGGSFVMPYGRIYVDANWAYNQYRHYYYSTPLKIEELGFTQIIGEEEAREYRQLFLMAYKAINTGTKVDDTTLTYFDVVPVEIEEEQIEESVIKENEKKPNPKIQKIIDNFGLLKFMEATNSNSERLKKLVDYKNLDDFVLYDFLNDVSAKADSPWISDYLGEGIFYKEIGYDVYTIITFGYGEIEMEVLNEESGEADYIVEPYRKLSKIKLYQLVEVAFLMFDKSIYNS